MNPLNRKYRSISLSLVAIFTATAFFIRCSQQPTTYLNLEPEVQYTGIESCQSCHKKIYKSFVETGMGKSFYEPDTSKIIEEFGIEALVYDEKEDFYYLPFWRENEMMVREFRIKKNDTTYKREEKIDYIVGSGHQTRSYILKRKDYFYEVPITWYVNKQIWDLSPGYDEVNTRFSREIGEECMTCHTGFIEHIEGSKNRYKKVALGIDCEKCHGPGEEHIRLIKGGQLIDVGEEIDWSIVNPGKLPINKQFDVCQQCHLQGVNVFKEGKGISDFRPGMDLNEAYEVFIEQHPDQNAFGIASHAERLQQSQCFINSNGKLSCTTCHDPHKSVSLTDEMLYINQCTQCHQQQQVMACSADEHLKATVNNNCVSCHMPSGGTSDIPHVSFHDHKIRVVEEQSENEIEALKEYLKLKSVSQTEPAADIWGQAWLLYFERHEKNPEYLKLADEKLASNNYYDKARSAYYQGKYGAALQLVEGAISQNANDPYTHFLKGEIFEQRQNYAEAHLAYQKSYQLNPNTIETGLKTGTMLIRSREGDPAVLEEAKVIFETLLKQKPFDERILTNLGFIMLNKREINKAESFFARALRYNPDYLKALENMIILQVVKSNKFLGRDYFDHLLSKYPDYAGKERLEKMLKALD